MSQASVVVCAYIYISYYEVGIHEAQRPDFLASQNMTAANTTATELTEEQLQMSLGILFAVNTISFALFLSRIDRKYIKTFFSTETGHARTKRFFLEGHDDHIKSKILIFNRYQWTSIRPQVAGWLDQNWDRWEREKPEWFDAVFIESVDDDIMPARVLARLKQEAEGGVRRRSSFMERVSVRVQERENDKEGSESDGSGGGDGRS